MSELQRTLFCLHKDWSWKDDGNGGRVAVCDDCGVVIGKEGGECKG